MELDDEATYTHFAHREAFFDLFNKFLECRLDEALVEQVQSDSEERLVESIGAIVCAYEPPVASLKADRRLRNISWISTYPCRLCWIPI
jgi:hypothetical protein